MYLSHLGLTNFRNFVRLELDLPPGVVVLSGGNAQGKTSLLEAMYLLSIARPFRADNEHEVVNWQAAREGGQALVAGTIEKKDQTLQVYVGYQWVAPPPAHGSQGEVPGSEDRGPRERPLGVRRQIRVSRVKRTAADLVGLVNAVVFTAEDLELVQGSPSGRRRFLDILMSQVDPSYLRTLQRYQRVLLQRNRLLRSLQERRAGEDELEFWDRELVKEGAWIVGKRYEAMCSLSVLCREKHRDLAGAGEDLRIEYRPNVPRHGQVVPGDMEREMAAALDASKRRELGMGSTVVGPHRDDFALLVNGVDMHAYASRGQARTLALTLRLSEAGYLVAQRGEGPILLLDDVLSELDATRRSHVLKRAGEYQQVIITTTDPESIERSVLPDASFYLVAGGRVVSAGTPAHGSVSQSHAP